MWCDAIGTLLVLALPAQALAQGTHAPDDGEPHGPLSLVDSTNARPFGPPWQVLDATGAPVDGVTLARLAGDHASLDRLEEARRRATVTGAALGVLAISVGTASLAAISEARAEQGAIAHEDRLMTGVVLLGGAAFLTVSVPLSQRAARELAEQPARLWTRRQAQARVDVANEVSR